MDLYIRNKTVDLKIGRVAVTTLWAALISLTAFAENSLNVSFLQWSFEYIYKEMLSESRSICKSTHIVSSHKRITVRVQ